MVPATQGQLTAWACGLDEQDVASGRARCGDFLPELMIEFVPQTRPGGPGASLSEDPAQAAGETAGSCSHDAGGWHMTFTQRTEPGPARGAHGGHPYG